MGNCTIRVAKTKALISCAVTAQLICGFFRLSKLLVFSCEGSYGYCKTNDIQCTTKEKNLVPTNDINYLYVRKHFSLTRIKYRNTVNQFSGKIACHDCINFCDDFPRAFDH